jgi:superfamily II DNA or RNA helicase
MGFQMSWGNAESEFAIRVVNEIAKVRRQSYRNDPRLIKDDWNKVQVIFQGDYRSRQIFELVQNGADAISEGKSLGVSKGKIKIVLTREGLYCANSGAPFSFEGITSLAYANSSAKSGSGIGRYGVGFKSVLAITDEPRVYSRSASFHFSFDTARNFLVEEPVFGDGAGDAFQGERALVAKHLGTNDRPKFYIASVPIPIDPEPFIQSDEILAGLSEWAATIIHLPFTASKQFNNVDRFSILAKAINTFPADFLIFGEHVEKLEMEIHDDFIQPRTISCVYGENTELDKSFRSSTVSVDEGGGRIKDWLVFEKSDIGIPNYMGNEGIQNQLNRRHDDEGNLLPVSITWAVPLSGNKLGTFWFFFPTLDTTTVRGIMNAPWDTDITRTRVVDCDYNKYLLTQFGDLIVSAVPEIIALFPDDPGKYLDFFPGRGYEERTYAGGALVEAIKVSAVAKPSMLDLAGDLQLPSSLRQPPTGITSELLQMWSATEGTHKNFPHWSLVDGGNRIARFNSYLEAADHAHGKQPVDAIKWLEELVADPTLERSFDALMLLSQLININIEFRRQFVQAKIVLCEDGSVACPMPGKVFYSSGGASKPGISIVDQRLLEFPQIRQLLIDECEIQEADNAAELDVVLASWPDNPKDEDWQNLWSAVGGSSVEDVGGALGRHPKLGKPFVMVAGGSFRPWDETFLPGKIFQLGNGDDDRIVDVSFHGRNLQVLNFLGVSEVPSNLDQPGVLPDAASYKAYLKSQYPNGDWSAAKTRNVLAGAPRVVEHMDLLESISDDAKARMTSWILEKFQSDLVWTAIRNESTVESPMLWYVKKHGLLETSIGPRKFGEVLSPTLNLFKRIAPVSVLNSELTNSCGLLSSFSDLPQHVLSDILTNLSSETDPQVIGDCLSLICKHLPVPLEIPCRVNNGILPFPPSEVTVVTGIRELDSFSSAGIPTVLAPNKECARDLAQHWGLKGDETVQQEYSATSPSESEMLTDIFFLLGEMHPRIVSGVSVVRCTALVNVIQTQSGQHSEELRFGLHNGTLYVVVSEGENNASILRAANDCLNLNLSEDDLLKIQENAVSQEIEILKRDIRAARSEIGKINVMFSPEQMKSVLPAKILDELAGEVDNANVLAEMLVAIYGPELLEKTKNLLTEKGLRPPTQWAGSPTAIKFVNELGFDRKYAGFKEPDRAAHTEVQGKVLLGDLHEYQQNLVEDIEAFIARQEESPKWRKLLYLPTGAGKTRVTVQAILEMMNEGKFGDRPILWIAQSYELCEQAVQSFTEVWSSMGVAGTLSVDRFWESKTVEQVSIPEEYIGQIVVAVDAKLSSAAVDRKEFDWLKNAALVVVDEAHRATGSSYTKILSWLETGVRLAKQDAVDKRPLLALSATPAKQGVQNRFGPEMIRIRPELLDGMDEHVYLKSIDVLAHARHEVLAGVPVGITEENDDLENSEDDDLSEEDSDVSLASNEKRYKGPWLPKAVEARLAESRERNANIIESILALGPSCPTIVFALSVSHAQYLAALLAINGVKSAAISGETSPPIRKLQINNFKSGKIQVLTNYGVLTTGFDAPKVEAIYITRPCFSKALYLQMIGRGLRGIRNGGTKECLIVDIADNIENMDIDLIYKEMGSWWTPEQGGDSGSGDTSEDLDSDQEDDDDSSGRIY